MKPDSDEKEFETLRKVLQLKRYERPPTEFRSDFMAEFRRRRAEVDEQRRHGLWRLWLWVTPDWAGAMRNVAAAVVALLLCANLVVLHHQRSASQTQIAAIRAPTMTTTPVRAKGPDPVPWPYGSVEPTPKNVAFANSYLLINEYYGQVDPEWSDALAESFDLLFEAARGEWSGETSSLF